jgi:hypothetical protein
VKIKYCKHCGLIKKEIKGYRADFTDNYARCQLDIRPHRYLRHFLPLNVGFNIINDYCILSVHNCDSTLLLG